MQDFAAVILTGGTGSRLGGADKDALEYAGRPLLEHALRAASGAGQIVVVGRERPTPVPVRFTRERPPAGGPAAGLLAGRDALSGRVGVLLLLAVDMPLVTAATVARLREALGRHDGAFLVDARGRRQPAGVLRVRAIDAHRPPPGREHGLPLHRLLSGLDLVDVATVGEETHDVDTWEDLAALEDPPRRDPGGTADAL